MTSASEEKGDFSIVFSVQGTGGGPTGPDPENRVGDQETGNLGNSVSCGLQMPGEPELGEFPAAFSFKMSFNCTSRDE